MMKIKRGSIVKDQWGRKWQAITYDKNENKWTLRLVLRHNHFYKFSPDFIERSFTKVSD